MKQKLAVPIIFRRGRSRSKGRKASAAKTAGGDNEDAPPPSSLLLAAASAAAGTGNSISENARDFPSIGRVNIVEPPKAMSSKVGIAVAELGGKQGKAVAAPSRPSASPRARPPQAREQAVDNGGGGGDDETTYSGQSLDEVGVSHLSMRDRMWYKNQLYLLKKQRQDQPQQQESRMPPLLTTPTSFDSASGQQPAGTGAYDSPARRNQNGQSSRYESNNDRANDRYSTAGVNNKRNGTSRYSPSGVNEVFDSSTNSNIYNNVRHGVDSKKEVRFLANKNQGGGRSNNHEQVEENENNHDTGNKSSSLMYSDDGDDTRTKSSSLFYSDDDTRTNPSRTSTSSSSLFGNVRDSRTTTTNRREDDDDIFDEVTLGSLEGETITEGETISEGGTYLTSLDDGTTTLDDGTATLDDGTATLVDDGTTVSSYVFELRDEDKSSRTYQMGVGRGGMTTKLRKGKVKTIPSSSSSAKANGTSSSGRRVRAAAPPNRPRKSLADDDADNEGMTCPIIPPEVLDEITGTYKDAKGALSQVLYAFFVSPDDIDRVSDKLRDAKLELVEMHHDQKKGMYNEI